MKLKQRVKIIDYSMPECSASRTIRKQIGKRGTITFVGTNGYIVKPDGSKEDWFFPTEDLQAL